ncbi:MAG: hypothetical protein AABW82_02750 [Nanoarchaeota archaeon]
MNTSNTKPADHVKTIGIIGISALVLGLGLTGVSYLDRNSRQSTIDGLYKTAESSRTMYFNGNPDAATRYHQDMWDGINAHQRNTLRDPWGRLTDKEMSHLETNLYSGNVFSHGPLVKPVVK